MASISEYIDIVKKHGYKKFMFRKIISDGFRNKHPEFQKEIDYLRRKGKLAVFPYEFMDFYKKEDYPAFDDKEVGMPYVMYEGKKLYLHYGWGGTDGASWMYFLLRAEQHPDSPHRYFTDEFYPESDDILIDIGCAEGAEALGLVDIVSEVYLFEYNSKWLKPLQKTFEPYGEKCHLIQKMVSDGAGEDTVTLDDIIPKGRNIILKLDVEGMEAQVLNGARQLIKESRKVKACVCTYHKSSDAKELLEMLSAMGFYCRYSDGYMLFTHSDDHPSPYFRHGLIRAKLENN